MRQLASSGDNSQAAVADPYENKINREAIGIDHLLGWERHLFLLPRWFTNGIEPRLSLDE